MKGFAGIDDIVVHDDSCSTTDLCDFESDEICGYSNDPIADFNWERGSGSSLSDTFNQNITDVLF